MGVCLIRTRYDPKPIPDRRWDWVAVEEVYEPGMPIGYGATEADAIADLLGCLQEAREAHGCASKSTQLPN